MVAKVCSWCGSRLGASAPMAASRTPPRRGVSAARTAGIVTASDAIRTTSAEMVKSARCRCIVNPPTADVLELLVRVVARRRDVVLHLRQMHHVPHPPEPGHVVRILQHD